MYELSESINKATDLIHGLAGPMCDDIGSMISDSMKPYRAMNLVNTLRRTERILREAGLPADAVPTRLLFPIIAASSIENNETLQEMWAGLLATASHKTDSVSPSFSETLRQMTPDEAKYIDKIFGEYADLDNTHLSLRGQLWFGGIPENVLVETFERLGIVHREYGLTEENEKPEVGYLYRFTKYGVAFLSACRGPQKVPASSSVSIVEGA